MRDGKHLNPEALYARAQDAADVADRAAIEAHLAACPACRDAVAALRDMATHWDALRARDAERDAGFEARLVAALDAQDAAVGRADAVVPRTWRRWPPRLAFAAAAGLVGLLLWFAPREAPRADLVTAAIQEGLAARAGRMRLDVATGDPLALERFFHAHGLAFPVRVIDLGMMGWRVAGGSVDAFAGRPSALTLYRDAEERALLCRMFEGTLSDLPEATSAFEHGGIEFRLYSDRGVTAVFWREGAVLCVLMSGLPPDAVRDLAVAKAMQPI